MIKIKFKHQTLDAICPLTLQKIQDNWHESQKLTDVTTEAYITKDFPQFRHDEALSN
jgi:hypothetical protein